VAWSAPSTLAHHPFAAAQRPARQDRARPSLPSNQAPTAPARWPPTRWRRSAWGPYSSAPGASNMAGLMVTVYRFAAQADGLRQRVLGRRPGGSRWSGSGCPGGWRRRSGRRTGPDLLSVRLSFMLKVVVVHVGRDRAARRAAGRHVGAGDEGEGAGVEHRLHRRAGGRAPARDADACLCCPDCR